MLKYAFTFLLSLGILFSHAQNTAQVQDVVKEPEQPVASLIKDIDINYLNEIIGRNDDTLYVFNFWATWCKPCVEELPYFNQLKEQYPGQKLKVILISNDSRKMRESKLEEFIIKKNIQCEVAWMKVVNANLWIDQVDQNWSGAIPATLLYKGNIGFRWFKEGEIAFEELNELVRQIIHQ